MPGNAKDEGEETSARSPTALGLAAALLLAVLALLAAAAGVQAVTQEAKLAPSDSTGAVAVDGDLALVGATEHDKDSDDDRADYGAAYLFTREGDTWTEQAMLSPDGLAKGAYFGGAVDLDGTTAVVGAHRDEVQTTYGVRSGAAYVYAVADGEATLEAKLTVDEPRRNLEVGDSVAIEDDVVLAGAPGETEAAGVRAPPGDTVYVFTPEDDWSEATQIRSGTEEHIDFGTAVDLDGHRALIGAPAASPGAGLNSQTGAAYTYTTRTGDSWTRESLLFAEDHAEGDKFGASLDLDGDRALVGAPEKDMNTSNREEGLHGAAYVFENDGGWSQVENFTAPGTPSYTRFGSDVALDGERGFIGARMYDGDEESEGAVYEVSRSGGNWTVEARFQPDDVAKGYGFGASLATDGSRLIASDNPVQSDRPDAAYVFTLGGASGADGGSNAAGSGGDETTGETEGADEAPGVGLVGVLAAGTGAALVRRRA